MAKQIEEKTNKEAKVNPDDAPIMQKKSKIPLITAVLAIVAGAGAFYFINSQKDLKIESKSDSEIVKNQEGSEKKEKEVNQKIENLDFWYKWNLELDMKIPKDKIKGNLKIEDFQILSMDKWLKSNISFGNLNAIWKEKWNEKSFQINNFDITTNEENTYIKIGWKDLKWFLEYIIKDSELINSLFGSGEYIKLDGAKPIIDLLWSNDELINSFIKWLVSSNPIHYWEKYRISEKARKKFLSKNSYKLFFKELETKDGKTYIGLKDGICEFALETAEKMKIPFPMNIEECNTQLVMVNDNLWEILFVTHKGDIEILNYDDGNNKIILAYENGNIVSFNLESPFGPTINYENKLLTIKYDSGELWKQIWMTAILNSTFNFEKLNFKIAGKYKLWDNELKVSWEWNQEKGKVTYMFTEKWVIVSKWQYQYQWGNHGLSIKWPLVEIGGKLLASEGKKQWQFDGKWGNNSDDTEKMTNIKTGNNFNNNISSKWLLEYNGSGEVNAAIIQVKADYISWSWNPRKVSTNANLRLKDSKLQFAIKHNEDEKVLSITWKGTWWVNNTDVNIVLKADWESVNLNLYHKDDISKSTIDIKPYNLILNSEISSNNPFMSIIWAIWNIYSMAIFWNIVENKNQKDKSIIDLKYNTTKDGNNSIIDGSYIISKWDKEFVSIALKWNISNEWFTYNIPTDVKEINWLDYVSSPEIGNIDIPSPESSKDRDMTRKANLTQIKTAIEMYYDDEWQYPKSDKLVNLQTIAEEMTPYMSFIPNDPLANKGNKYHYMSLKSYGTNDGSAILVAEMENSENCNFQADSIEKIQQIIEKNDRDIEKLEKLKTRNVVETNPCFYVIFPN